jgi:hypothetical protein
VIFLLFLFFRPSLISCNLGNGCRVCNGGGGHFLLGSPAEKCITAVAIISATTTTSIADVANATKQPRSRPATKRPPLSEGRTISTIADGASLWSCLNFCSYQPPSAATIAAKRPAGPTKGRWFRSWLLLATAAVAVAVTLAIVSEL